MLLVEIILISMLSVVLLLLLLPLIFKMFQILFKKTKYRQMGQSTQIRLIRQLQEAAEILSKSKTGAIITILNKEDISEMRTDGIKIDANISTSLIVAIFNKNSPLHDGAIIIDNSKISYAGTYYKITSSSVDNKYGARHRAALGISEECDALIIIVSEETGAVSFAKNGKLMKIKLAEFQEKLIENLKE